MKNDNHSYMNGKHLLKVGLEPVMVWLVGALKCFIFCCMNEKRLVLIRTSDLQNGTTALCQKLTNLLDLI